MTHVGTHALHIYDTAGVKQAIITDFRSLTYVRQVNRPGALWFSIAGDHDVLDSISDKWRVEVRRRRPDLTWDTELWALFRNETWAYPESGSEFQAYCQGIKSILGWRIINWPAGTANRSSFTSDPAETIMKTLVDFNAGPNATSGNGRKRTGTISGLTIEADAAGGNTINWNCHGKNLLETLFDLSEVGGGDFDLAPSSATAYEFQFHSGQLGTDRSLTVLFSMGIGNMGDPEWSVSRAQERTVAAVWGQGEGSDRDYVTRTGTNYAADNDIEEYVDAKTVELGNTSALQAKGDAELSKLEAKEMFQFKALSNESTRYREHFDLGDLVSAKNPFNGAISTLQIKAVTVKLDRDGNEDVEVEVESQ